MNKFSKFLEQYLLKPIKASFSRFPEIFVELLILALILIYDNRNRIFEGDYQRIIQSIINPMFVLIIFHSAFILGVEKYNLKRLNRILGGVGIGLFATSYGLYYFLNFGDQFNFFLTFSNSAIILGGIVAFVTVPYFYKRANFTIYLPYLLTRLLLTIFYTGSLILGTIGIIGLADFLFRLSINSRIYTDIIILFSTLIGGPLFLGYLPSIDKKLTKSDFGIVWKVLIIRIIIPLSTIATLIIFAYASLGRLTGVYDGSIFLVSAFSSLSVVLVAIVLAESFETEINYVKWFRKYLPYPMLLLVLNLGVEVILEIVEKGINVNNYFTGLFTDFFLAAYLLLLIKKLYQPILIPLLLSGSLLFAGFTPFIGVKDWTFRSISNQLTTTLSELNMLNNNVITPRPDLPTAQKDKINSILGDLSSYHGFNNISYLPNDFDLSKTESVFGFGFFYDNRDNTYLSVGTNLALGFDVSGYDKVYQFNTFKNEVTIIESYQLRISNNKLIVSQNNTVVAEADLNNKMAELNQLNSSGKFEISPSEMTVNFSASKFKLIITFLGANVRSGPIFDLESITGLLLVDE
jgi:hypothetical protein